MKALYKFQIRTDAGWKTARWYKGLHSAFKMLRSVNGTDMGAYRIIAGDPSGEFQIIATRG